MDRIDARRLPLVAHSGVSAYAHQDRADKFGGRRFLKKICAAMCAVLLLAACARHPMTDQELQGEAQHAVDDKLETQAAFTSIESTAAQQIACGHAFATDAPNRGRVDQDFVYLHGRLIMDDDPDFDQAAMECDVAASGGNAMAVGNATDG